MGEIGIADLGDVVSVAEIQDFLTGKAIRCSGEAFCMDTGVTLLTIDKGIYADRNGLTSGVVRFGLREERDFLRVIKSVNRDGFLKNDDILYPDEFAVSCDPELLTDHEIIDIFYCIQGYNQTIDRPILRFAGARVPGTNIGMIVKGIEFIRDELFGVKKRISVDIQLHPQQRADAHVPEGAYKKEKTERKSPDLNVPGYTSWRGTLLGP
ncbi:MAG: hypothetical protein NT001_01475 [Candidatus Woesearchaeota archaeon]|nr:hypothetical protein [Candidatus Woesearchaeota archaeon]